jgi:membrane-associated phospholipid phosphatase
VILLVVLGQLLLVVTLLLVVATIGIVGRERVVATRREFRTRFAAVAPYVGLLAVVLVANKIARDIGPDLSRLVGIRISGWLEEIDGVLLWPLYPSETPQVVAWLQSMATPELTAYFSFIYVFGYVLLLVFPFIACFALPRPHPLRRTIIAYSANYVIGVLCYIIFIAYGPRNVVVDQVDGLLFSQYTQYQFITEAVNDETNVFPSLHASMAVTASLLAWTTRDEYPAWVPISAVLAGSVVVSTMYLGIHWATDVVFGILLAWVSVAIGVRFEDTPPSFESAKHRLSAVASLFTGRRG